MQAIECYAQQANVYEFLKKNDSVNIITENASLLFEKVGKVDRASQILGLEISSLLDMGELEKARSVIEAVVKNSNKPVTLKLRKGWDTDHIVAVQYAQMAEKAGISAITIHGRTRKV